MSGTPVADLGALTRAEVAALHWHVSGDPVIGPPFPSPVVADPTFLPPASTPDGRWHLWAHSLVGLHHWTSADGDTWTRDGTVARNSLRAHVVDVGATGSARYRLAYERTRLFLPLGLPWRSWLESRRSADLRDWSAPTVLLRPTLPWHDAGRLGSAVSNPCLVPRGDGTWWLYYSAGLVRLDDCGFAEPACVGVATGPGPDGPFTPRPEPLLAPDPADPLGNHAAGAVKVVRVADGWVAFQNAISWDAAAGRSSSAIRLLGSTDGLEWEPLRDGPIVAPTGAGWRGSHVYALDVRPTPYGVRLYFNARSVPHWTRGREAIGLATALRRDPGDVGAAAASPPATSR